MKENTAMTSMKEKESAIIKDFKLDDALLKRLMTRGVRKDKSILLLKKNSTMLLILINNAKIAIDAKIGRNIIVNIV